jgi:hypothetical protein
VKKRTRLWAGAFVVAAVAAFGAVATAANAADNDGHVQNIVFERLTGFQEDPLAISSPASATFTATIDDKNQQINYKLSYKGFTDTVLQSHLHFGNKSASGGVSFFLCTNLNNAPAGTQACPQGDATITGTITPANILGPTAQGIPAGGFDQIVQALRAGRTYVNIHTNNFPGGEIRAQIDGEL